MEFTTIGIFERFLLAIKPDTNLGTEKFSLNLHRWLNDHRSLFAKAFFLREPGGTEFSESLTLPPLIYIGLQHGRYVVGSRLSEILSLGVAAGVRAYPVVDTEWLDITEGFWERYSEKGKCALDPEHGLYWEKDRDEDLQPGIRRCRWCQRLSPVPSVLPAIAPLPVRARLAPAASSFSAVSA